MIAHKDLLFHYLVLNLAQASDFNIALSIRVTICLENLTSMINRFIQCIEVLVFVERKPNFT